MRMLLDKETPGGGGTEQAKVQLPVTTPTQPKNPNDSRSLKVEMPKDPPKEVLDINFDIQQLPTMDKEEGGPAAKVEDKKAIEDKKEEKAPAPEQKADKVAEGDKKEPELPKYLKPPKGKEGEKKADDKNGQGDGIDYAKYSPAEANYLKNMSREARVFTADLITQNKELNKLKGGTYLQHPDAYTLSPEWKGATEQVSAAQQEGAAWRGCLEAIKLGKPFKPPVKWDNNGNLVFGDAIQPTDALEEEVRLNMQNCVKTANDIQGQMRTYAQNHKQQITNDLSIIQQENENRFDWVKKNPALQDYSITMSDGKGGFHDKTIKQIKTDFKSLFPAYMRDNPATETASNIMVALIIAKAEIEELKSSKTVVQTKLEEQKRVEPTSEVQPGKQTEPVGGVREFNTTGMEL